MNEEGNREFQMLLEQIRMQQEWEEAYGDRQGGTKAIPARAKLMQADTATLLNLAIC